MVNSVKGVIIALSDFAEDRISVIREKTGFTHMRFGNIIYS